MSRTHSQLTQVVKELNRTVYRPKPMTILGSREQLCINKTSGFGRIAMRNVTGGLNVAHRRVSADENCTNLLNNKQCDAFNNQYRLRAAIERGNGVYDIEDLCKAGEKINACPYFTARSMLRTPNSAKLVLCPYNYVIDPPIRRSLGLSLKGSVLIFDEVCSSLTMGFKASRELMWLYRPTTLRMSPVRRQVVPFLGTRSKLSWTGFPASRMAILLQVLLTG